MDTRKEQWREERVVSREPGDNLVVFSDGGTHLDCSASAWVFCIWVDRGCVRILVPAIAAGILIPTPMSSFAAEAIAFEMATKEVKSWRHAEMSAAPSV